MPRTIPSSSALLVCALALAIVTLPPPTAAADLESDLLRILADFQASNPTAPGVSLSVVCPPLGLDWSGAVGQTGHDTDEALTPAHTFRIASNTKTYVAAAVLRLVEVGRLRLDQPLAGLLPPHQATLLAGDGYDLAAITLRHVMSHTAGLADHTDGDDYGAAIIADPWHVWTPDEQLQRCVDLFDPLGPPGQRYAYSDTGYVLLGSVLEQVTGRSLGAAVRELLDYRRLGLKATWWELMDDAPATAGPRARQYFGDHDVTDWHPSSDLFGGGGLLTDVVDLGRFLWALLTGRVLREESSLAAMTGQGTAGYRLGLMCTDLAGHLAWGHTGFWNTFAYHVPTLDLTIAGCVLNHAAERGRVLAESVAARVAGDTSAR